MVETKETTKVIEEKPVLDKVETEVRKEVVEKPHIHENIKQQEIEIHEKPVLKEVLHPEKEVLIKDQDKFEVVGREETLREKERLLAEMQEQAASHAVHMEEKEAVHVSQEAPSVTREKEVQKEIVEKPIVTEVHYQPITEIHEQNTQRTIHEKPVVKVVRDNTARETVVAKEPLATTTTATTTTTTITATTTVPGASTKTTLGEKLHNLKESIKEKFKSS
jgi:hypothetical protein